MSVDAGGAQVAPRPETRSGHRTRARARVPTAARWPDTVGWCPAPVSECRARSGRHVRPAAPASALQRADTAAVTARTLLTQLALLKILVAASKRDATRAL